MAQHARGAGGTVSERLGCQVEGVPERSGKVRLVDGNPAMSGGGVDTDHSLRGIERFFASRALDTGPCSKSTGTHAVMGGYRQQLQGAFRGLTARMPMPF